MSAAHKPILTAVVNLRVAPPTGAALRVLPNDAGTDRLRDREEETDPRLRELSARAHELIDALRRAVPVTEMGDTLTGYVRAARAIGVGGERLHDALELLVHEHARGTGGRPLATGYLHDLLHLADPTFRLASCAHWSGQ